MTSSAITAVTPQAARKNFASVRRAATTVASWLVELEPGRSRAVRQALSGLPGVECRSEVHGTLVVLTESADPALDELRDRLMAVPGVRGAALVTSFRDEDEPSEVLGPTPAAS